MGGNTSCFSTSQHLDGKAVHAGGKMGSGGDLDAAVLAATNFSQGGLSNKLSLTFECENLPNLDTFSKSDPFVIFYKKSGNVWTKCGMTEVIHDNLNPKFITPIVVDYHFEQSDRCKLEVYDVDDDTQVKNLSAQEYIGSIEFDLHEVVTSRDQIMHRDLGNNPKIQKCGSIVVTAEEMEASANSEILIMTPEAELPDQSGVNFFIVYRWNGPKQYVPIYKSEIKKVSNDGKFKWNQVQLGCSDLCKDDVEREIKIEFYRSNPNGNHKCVGFTTTTLAVLKSEQRDYPIQSKGNLHFEVLKVERKHSFLEYIFGGCEVDLSIAIDFTLSNGPPQDRNSLHYFDPKSNQYLQAIKSVGNILQYYNQTKKINLYGFGGAIPPYNQRASHCFALNGNIFNPMVNGLDEVVQCYQRALQNINLYGPTHFSKIIEPTISKIEMEEVSQYNQKYSILLIITDGIINDMKQTIDQIVRGSSKPLSIIIVGVGDADFSNMDILDGDDEALYSTTYRRYCDADIVQFVPFNEFKNNPHMLAKETLEEVPGQLLNYMRKNGISPMPRSEAERQQIKNQLTLAKNNQNQGNAQVPRYFLQKQEEFQQKAQEIGYDIYQVQDFIREKGLPENNFEFLIDQLNNPGYKNVLRAVQQSQMYGAIANSLKNQVASYGYFDPNQAQNVPAQQPMQQQQMQQQQMPQQQMPQQQVPQQQQEDNMCKLCMSNQINTAIVPCGHRVNCMQCTNMLRGTCPICNQPVQQVMQTFTA